VRANSEIDENESTFVAALASQGVNCFALIKLFQGCRAQDEQLLLLFGEPS
jgi:hypothetical protein